MGQHAFDTSGRRQALPELTTVEPGVPSVCGLSEKAGYLLPDWLITLDLTPGSTACGCGSSCSASSQPEHAVGEYTCLATGIRAGDTGRAVL